MNTHSIPSYSRTLIGLAILLASGLIPRVHGVALSFLITSEEGAQTPCRIHLSDDKGEPIRPPGAPFWRGGFVCDGAVSVDIPSGRYHYEIERGPEWAVPSGTIHLREGNPAIVSHTLKRVADLKAEGWYGGDLHVHRTPNEFPLHLKAEDLSIASIQT